MGVWRVAQHEPQFAESLAVKLRLASRPSVVLLLLGPLTRFPAPLRGEQNTRGCRVSSQHE